MKILLTPFVWLLMFFYNIFNNYGIALILFALLVKVLLFPFSLKGKRGMIQMNAMQAKTQKLQKMYGNNKEKYNLEVQKLYEKEKVNPMGGCLWTMLPLLVLLPLYAIVREPLTYMMNVVGQVQFDAIASAVNWGEVAKSMGWINDVATSFSNMGYNQLYLASLITPENLSAVQAVAGESANMLAVNFNFLGLNLAHVPNWQFWVGGISWASIGLALMPLISAGSSLVFSMVSMKTNSINQQTQATNSTSKTMLLMSPIISLWIGFSMPAALSVYWIAQSLISMAQEAIASKMLKKDYEKAAEEAAKREAEEKEEEKNQKELERQERAKRIEEQKSGKAKKAPKKETEEDKIPGAVKEASRVGIRTYARGRAYDPTRFHEGGPTPYGMAHLSETRQTVEEEELKLEAEELEQGALAQAADVAIVESILEEQGLEADVETITQALVEDTSDDSAEDGETKKPE